MTLMERRLHIPNGTDCSDCPFYQYDPRAQGCSNGMICDADTTDGKRNAECLKEFPNGAVIWFEKAKT